MNEITILKAVHENSILQTQIEIQEQTFQNISREIHDNVGQKLSLAKLQIFSLLKHQTCDLDSVAALITTAISDLRNLSRTLSSENVLANGLLEAIKFEISQLKKTNCFVINLEAKGEVVFLDGRSELILFRIIQEALQNIIKHANAKSVLILIDYHPTKVITQIIDNGGGFLTSDNTGQGLKNMQARAKILGGQCLIKSSQNNGTIVNIHLPIKKD